MKKINLLIVALFITIASFAHGFSDFENLTLGSNTYWDGSDLSGGFASGHAYFVNRYDTSFGGYWAGGFIYTNKTNDTTSGFANSASAITGGGFGGSHNYAIAYDEGDSNVIVRLTQSATGKLVQGFYVTNTAYAYFSMLRGDQFEPAFSYEDRDSLVLRIYGYKNGVRNPNYQSVYLASFTSPDTTQNYILNKWQWVSLLALGNVDSLLFTMASSERPNTPTYFAIDNFVTADLPLQSYTILYNQDTLINVMDGLSDTTGGPFTVQFVRNSVPGASVAVDSMNRLWYIPEAGIVGIDTVVYVICNGAHVCDTAEVIINLLSPTGIQQLNMLETKVYPNPFSNSFSVYHTSDVKTVDLYDLEGRLIRTIPCNTGELITAIQTDDLQAGSYIVKVISAQATGIAKVIKQ